MLVGDIANPHRLAPLVATANSSIAMQAYSVLAESFIAFQCAVCRPHSVLAVPLQRPARSSSPNITARVQGQQPMLV